MLPGSLTIAEAAPSNTTLGALLWSLLIGSVLFVPGLIWLLALSQRTPDAAAAAPSRLERAP
jgi:cytochrome bd-type quinol oxidase subunit 2